MEDTANIRNIEDTSEGLDDEPFCCICFEGERFVLTPCYHLFCQSCISRWIMLSGSCPMCRKELREGQLVELIGSVEETVARMKQMVARHTVPDHSMKDEDEDSQWGWDAFHHALTRLRRELSLWNEAFFDNQTTTREGEEEVENHYDSRLGNHQQETQPETSHQLLHSLHYPPTSQPFSQSFLSFCCLPQPTYTTNSLTHHQIYSVDY
jgi:hypothetical protein